MTYTEYVMKLIANIIYNSQSEGISKQDIVNSLKIILEEYNEATGKNIR